ncbi:MAG: DUF4197 domain-containing protein [Chitinophagales bacterium]|nr:DUF4197 domain-containing protein [Chitinophagales bacterium]
MLKQLFLLSLAIFITTTLSAQSWKDKLNEVKNKVTETTGGSGLSQEEVGKGLKEALNIGVNEAVDFLSVEDGYYASAYKILLPDEAQKAVNKLKSVPGFSKVEQDLTLRINRAAESAAEKAKPIFVSAIKQLTFQDAMNLLMGKQDAATRYLEKTTYDQLYNEFKPVIIEALDEVNARSLWNNAATTYNKLPFTEDVTTELDDYVVHKALVGLFGLVEVKELDIRENTASRTSDLLRKVFAKQDK